MLLIASIQYASGDLLPDQQHFDTGAKGAGASDSPLARKHH